MERCEEMEEYIEDYRHGRMIKKREFLLSHYNDLLTPLLTVVDTLIQDMEEMQTAKEQGKIKSLIFHRLLSSGYTGSYEMSVGMSNATLYLDEHMSCTYWKPEVICQDIEEDMKKVRQILNNKYTHIEEYELLRLKQDLLFDDWNLFCEALDKMAERLAEKMKDSPLQLEDEIQILYGDYMDRLNVAYTMQTESILASDKS